MANILLSVQHLYKTYANAGQTLQVLTDIHFDIYQGETVSIVGPSGSGKTTLLGLCAGLDQSTKGQIILNGVALETLNEDQRAQLRNQSVGFVFQNFQLIPTLTALENIQVPLELQGKKNSLQVAKEWLAQVGLAQRGHHYPEQLSGGEQQRVSIARAFANTPSVLFADEPTGNLDHETGQHIEKLLFDLNRQHGTTLILVTHDLELAQKTQRMIRMKGGQIIEDTPISSTPQNIQ